MLTENAGRRGRPAKPPSLAGGAADSSARGVPPAEPKPGQVGQLELAEHRSVNGQQLALAGNRISPAYIGSQILSGKNFVLRVGAALTGSMLFSLRRLPAGYSAGCETKPILSSPPFAASAITCATFS